MNKLIKLFGAVILFTAIFSLMPSNKVEASDTCGNPHQWGINSGSSTSNGGLVIKTYIYHLDGSEEWINSGVRIEASANAIDLTPNGSYVSSTSSLALRTGDTFYRLGGSSNPCNLPGHIPFGYGSSSSNGNQRSLDCKNSSGATNTFRVDIENWKPTAYGHWENKIGGGGWGVINGVSGSYILGFNFSASNGYTVWNELRWVEESPPPPSTTQIQAHVFMTDTAGNITGEVSGATMETCGWGNPTTASNGFVYFNVNNTWGFCVRVIGGGPSSADYDGPFIRPWSEGYGSQPGCTSGYGGPPYSGYCTQTTYEYQAAGTNAGNGYDRSMDGGYDIVYVKKPTPTTGVLHGYRGITSPTTGNFCSSSCNNTSPPGRANIKEGTITAANDVSTSSHWTFGQVSAGNHSIKANDEGSYTVEGYTMCKPSPPGSPCPGSYNIGLKSNMIAASSGTAVTFNVPAGGEVYVYWWYKVNAQPPTGSVSTANCTTVKATATDPDNSGKQLNFRLKRDGNATPIATGVSSGTTHEITFNYAAGWEPYQDKDSHTVTVEVENVDAAGVGTGTWVQIGSNTIGPCLAATCQSITVNGGAPVEAGKDFEVQVVYKNTGLVPLKADPATNPVRVGITDGISGTTDTGDQWVPLTSPNGVTTVGGDPHTRLTADIPVGINSPIIKFTIRAPATLTSKPLYPRLIHDKTGGSQFFGGACSGGTVSTLARFTFTATAVSVNLTPDAEDPTQATGNYTSGLTMDGGAVAKPVGGVTATRATTLTQVNGVTTKLNKAPPGVTAKYDNASYSFGPHTLVSVAAGDIICANTTISPATGLVDASGNVTNGTGEATGTAICDTVAHKPYFKVFGGDTLVGGYFANVSVCSGTPLNGTIKGWLKPDGTSGSGVQFAVIARGDVDGVASAMLRTLTPPIPPDDLTLANTSGPDGNFNLQPGCVTDYYGTTQSTAVQDISTIPLAGLNVSGLYPAKSGRQSKYGPTPTSGTRAKLIAGANIGKLRHTMYIEGDVFIENDIIYDAAGWSLADGLPYFTVIAKGNIYIGKNVKRLDGLYIAQTNGAVGGKIYTCATITGPYNPVDLFANCGNQLVVNGSFIAQSVKLLRTFSSLSDSLAGESNASRICSKAGGATGQSCAAEIFDPGPEVFLGTPVFAPRTESKSNTYDSFGGLPVIL